MGLLDELKQQAESVLVRQRTSEESQNQKLQASHARMRAALQYWVDFFKALNVVNPVITRSYYVEGSTQLQNLVQCDYDVNSRRITVQQQDYIDSIELRFRCASQPHKLRTIGRRQAEALAAWSGPERRTAKHA